MYVCAIFEIARADRETEARTDAVDRNVIRSVLLWQMYLTAVMFCSMSLMDLKCEIKRKIIFCISLHNRFTLK